MSNAVSQAIARAKEKRERRLAKWWENKMRDPVERAKIEANRARFVEEFAKGEPMTYPEPPVEETI